MAFVFTVDATDTTGRSKVSQMRGPNYIRYSGTFTFTNPTTNGTIDLTDTAYVPVAASLVKEYELHTTDGTVTSVPKSRANYTGGGVAAAGKIGILLASNDLSGTWTALVVP